MAAKESMKNKKSGHYGKDSETPAQSPTTLKPLFQSAMWIKQMEEMRDYIWRVRHLQHQARLVFGDAAIQKSEDEFQQWMKEQREPHP